MPKCSFCHSEKLEAEVWQSKVDLNNHYCHDQEACVIAWGKYSNPPKEHL